VSLVRRTPLRLVIVALAAALALAACGSSSKGGGGSTASTGSTVAQADVPQGGKLTIGAEQEPDCMDWIGTCAGSSWGYWMAENGTIPFAMLASGSGGDLTNTPGPVLAGAPEVTQDPVETITYKINPDAHWSDNEPITCDDFKYTADQQQNGKDIYDRTGYVDLEPIKCTDPKTVVVKYKPGKTFASWELLFSGTVGILPSHILNGKDRNALMKDGYTWSGGPWVAKWIKTDSIVMTPNANYWGPKPKLDQVTFKILPDTAAEFQAYRSGQVQMIYPQPQLDVVAAIGQGLPDSNTLYNANTGAAEALWINNEKAPFDDVVVRQALGYSIDRDAIVNRLFGGLGVKTAVNSLNPPVVKDYSNPDAWANYKLDLDKVTSLMTGDGWAKGSDGVWAKGGQKASFTINSTTSNKRRELTETIVQQQLKAAGFDMKIANQKAADLFGETLPKGDYQVGLFANQLTSLIPGECNLFCSENIPTAANGNSGNNWYRVNIPELDPLLRSVDQNLDDATRKSDAAKADDIMARDQVTLPLDPLPDIVIWNKSVVGPVGDNAIMGPFWNLAEWGVKK
jgi:peptide/nickel transport system substrate-binding protein